MASHPELENLVQEALSSHRDGQGDQAQAILRHAAECVNASLDTHSPEQLSALLQGAKSILGSEHEDLARIHFLMSLKAEMQDETEQAWVHAQRGLELSRPKASENPIPFAECAHHAAHLLWRKRNFEQAATLIEEARAYAAALGSLEPLVQHLDRAQIEIFLQRGAFQDALQRIRQTLQSIQDTGGNDALDRFEFLMLEGATLRVLGQTQQTAEVFRQAADLAAHHEEELLQGRALRELGDLQASQGNFTQAEEHHRQALTLLEGQLDPGDPTLANTLTALAAVYLYGEPVNPEPALPLLERALGITTSAFGSDHPATADLLCHLGTLRFAQEKHDDAEQLLGRAISIYEQHYGSPNLPGAMAYNTLGLVHQHQDNLDQARNAFGRALQALEALQGPDDPNVAQLRENLSRLNESKS